MLRRLKLTPFLNSEYRCMLDKLIIDSIVGQEVYQRIHNGASHLNFIPFSTHSRTISKLWVANYILQNKKILFQGFLSWFIVVGDVRILDIKPI